MPVMGNENLKLYICGITQVITDVSYLRGLKNNLLSIGQLLQKNMTKILKNDACKVHHSDNGLVMYIQMSSNKMFVIFVHLIIPMYLNFTIEDDT